jgi:hypothetical protein
MLLNLDRHTTTSTIYLILLTNVADDTILKLVEEIDLNATIYMLINTYILNIWFYHFNFFLLFVHKTRLFYTDMFNFFKDFEVEKFSIYNLL